MATVPSSASLTYDQDYGNLGDAVLANLMGDLFVAQVYIGPLPSGPGGVEHLVSVAVGVVGDGRHHDLLGRQANRANNGSFLR
jgi:hypothetical protein